MSSNILICPLLLLVTYFVYVNARTSYYKKSYSNYQNYQTYSNDQNYQTYSNDQNYATTYNNPPPQPLPTGDDCLTEHNRLRYRHNVVGLEYDATLEQYAIKRAKYMAKTDIFEHPANLPYGENLYWRSGTPPTCKDASDAWYNEISLYSYKNPGFSSATGHFTQMVWKKSTHIGCASAKSKRTGRVYIACNYWPRGNVLGRFKENVPVPRYWWLR